MFTARGPTTFAAAALLCASIPLRSQGQPIPAPAISLHGYRPSPFSDRFVELDGTDVLPSWRLRAGVDADYGWRSLLLDPAPGSAAPAGAVVRHVVGAQISAAVGVADRLELAVALPLTAYQTGDSISNAAPPDRSGLEEVRLGAKVHLLGSGVSGPGLAAVAFLDVPAGGGGGLLRADGVGGEARLLGDLRFGRFTGAVGAGYRLRSSVRLYDIALGNEIVGAAGLAMRVASRTRVLVELDASTAAANPFSSGKQTPAEALLALAHRVGPWTLMAGAGPGLVDGYGTPALRALASVAWTNAPAREAPVVERSPYPPTPRGPKPKRPAPDPKRDTDGDGIPDVKDKCPTEAEDKDGFEDDDGCPDPDNDKDGIADTADKCPNQPETVNNVDDDDGCPDTGGLVRLKDKELETLSPIFFDTDRARVRHAFWPTLDAIAAILTAHPEIGRCAIEGHTDATGPKGWNQELSMRRAQAVVRYLADRGVAAARLVPIGHGDALPWAPNDTAEGRAANRRVIFHIEGVDPEQAAREVQIQKARALKRVESE